MALPATIVGPARLAAESQALAQPFRTSLASIQVPQRPPWAQAPSWWRSSAAHTEHKQAGIPGSSSLEDRPAARVACALRRACNRCRSASQVERSPSLKRASASLIGVPTKSFPCTVETLLPSTSSRKALDVRDHLSRKRQSISRPADEDGFRSGTARFNLVGASDDEANPVGEIGQGTDSRIRLVAHAIAGQEVKCLTVGTVKRHQPSPGREAQASGFFQGVANPLLQLGSWLAPVCSRTSTRPPSVSSTSMPIPMLK